MSNQICAPDIRLASGTISANVDTASKSKEAILDKRERVQFVEQEGRKVSFSATLVGAWVGRSSVGTIFKFGRSVILSAVATFTRKDRLQRFPFILPPQYVISKTWQQIMFCKSSLFNFQLWKPESQLVETAWHCQIWNFVFLYFCICNWKPSVQLEETAWHCPKPLCRLISDSGQLEGPLISILYFYRVFFICILYFENQGPWEFLMGQVTAWKRGIPIETARSQEHT